MNPYIQQDSNFLPRSLVFASETDEYVSEMFIRITPPLVQYFGRISGHISAHAQQHAAGLMDKGNCNQTE